MDAGGAVVRHVVKPPSGIGRLGDELPFKLPDSIAELYSESSGGAILEWNVSKDVFGLECRRGYMHLLSPDEIIMNFRHQNGVVADAISEGLDGEKGFASLIEDWPYWLPVFRFRNGDCFCLEGRETCGGEPSVVFLEHDVMDAGPNLHGIRLASSFSDLLRRWSDVFFVELSDWADAVVDGSGIDADAPVFSSLRRWSRMD